MKRGNWTREPIQTYCEVDGVELEVACFYEYQPEEYDTNTAESFEVTGAYYEDQGCILDKLSGSELESLTERVLEAARPDVDAYGDWLYDQRKDDRLDA